MATATKDYDPRVQASGFSRAFVVDASITSLSIVITSPSKNFLKCVELGSIQLPTYVGTFYSSPPLVVVSKGGSIQECIFTFFPSSLKCAKSLSLKFSIQQISCLTCKNSKITFFISKSKVQNVSKAKSFCPSINFLSVFCQIFKS